MRSIYLCANKIFFLEKKNHIQTVAGRNPTEQTAGQRRALFVASLFPLPLSIPRNFLSTFSAFLGSRFSRCVPNNNPENRDNKRPRCVMWTGQFRTRGLNSRHLNGTHMWLLNKKSDLFLILFSTAVTLSCAVLIKTAFLAKEGCSALGEKRHGGVFVCAV